MGTGKIKIKAEKFTKPEKQAAIENYREPSDDQFGAFKVAKEAASKLGFEVSEPEKEGKCYRLRILTASGKAFASITLEPRIHVMPIEEAAIRIRDLVIEAVSSGGKDPAIQAKLLTEQFTTN